MGRPNGDHSRLYTQWAGLLAAYNKRQLPNVNKCSVVIPSLGFYGQITNVNILSNVEYMGTKPYFMKPKRNRSWRHSQSFDFLKALLYPGPTFTFNLSFIPSDREKYFEHVGQNIRQAFSALPDFLSRWHFFLVDDWQRSSVILVFLVGHFMCFGLCQTKCPARAELSAGHHHKSDGHVWHVQHISRSLHTLLFVVFFLFFFLRNFHVNVWFSRHYIRRGLWDCWVESRCSE